MNGYLNFLGSQRICPVLRGLSEIEILPRTYISLFSGGGGLDLGFSIAGFEGVYSTDVLGPCCETLRHNFPGTIVKCQDICGLSGSSILADIAGREYYTHDGEVDAIIGGPPCQAFSIIGKRKAMDDPRGKLVFEYVRMIKEIQPKAFLFENVPGLLTVNKGKDWQDLLEHFRSETGYHLSYRKLNAMHYGVPQSRERVILIGTNKAEFTEWPETDITPPFTAGMALENVDGLPNHDKRVHTPALVERFAALKQGERDRKGFLDRVSADKPSGTVLAGSGKGGARPFVHPTEHRQLTARETARLQSFPDWYVFKGTNSAQFRQIGNAVPPMLAMRLALQLLQHFRDNNYSCHFVRNEDMQVEDKED